MAEPAAEFGAVTAPFLAQPRPLTESPLGLLRSGWYLPALPRLSSALEAGEGEPGEWGAWQEQVPGAGGARLLRRGDPGYRGEGGVRWVYITVVQPP